MTIRNVNSARAACAFVFASLLFAGVANAGTVSVSGGWIRALPANVPSGGYFNLSNDSGKRIVLTGAASPACGMLMLHKSDTTGGMASMSDVAGIAVAVGARLSFAPGGYHLMCEDPTGAVKPGANVPVELQFSDKTSVRVPFAVKDARGK